MQESLKLILEIQELDMKMVRLMRVKKQRQNEVSQIEALLKDLRDQLAEKEKEIKELGFTIQSQEARIQEIEDKLKRLEEQQNLVKKIDEFNALTKEITSTEREKINVEQQVSDLVDKKVVEEEILEKIKESLKTSEESSLTLKKEIESSISLINQEGSSLKKERDSLAIEADAPLLAIYERLLRNKRDRVLVAIENRSCTGCHISLTAQHENSVRKGENLVFCEHCSRIHYWQEAEAVEGNAAATKRRRRRATTT